MVSVPARRQQVAYGRGRGLSARRACTLFSVARSALEYRSRKAAKDAPVVTRMKELSAQYPPYGLSAHPHFPQPRRLSHEPRPGAPAVANGKAAGAAQAAEEAHSRCAAAAPASTEWAEPGLVLRLRVRPLRQWSAAQVPDCRRRVHQGRLGDRCRRPLRSGCVIEVLSRLVSARGAPRFVRSDNGPEFVFKALLSWIVTHGIGTALIEPGKPWQATGVAESFNGKFRDECRTLEWFCSRAEAKVLIEEWR